MQLYWAVTGSYTGNGATGRLITLGFRPKVLFLKEGSGSPIMVTDVGSSIVCEYSKYTTTMIELDDSGFKVSYRTHATGAQTVMCSPYTNRDGLSCYYVAFR